jgi:hypothetical protein
MIEQESPDRPIASTGKDLCKSARVEALDAPNTVVTTAQEFNASVWMVRVEVRDLIGLVRPTLPQYICSCVSHLLVQAFVQVVSVRVLQLSNFFLVFGRMGQQMVSTRPRLETNSIISYH